MHEPRQTPNDFIAALDRASERYKTRMGNSGELVWRIWGRGHGEPLVLLHGGTGSWLHWVRNVDALAHDFRVLAPDLPGSGESASPTPPVTAERVARSVSFGLASILG